MSLSSPFPDFGRRFHAAPSFYARRFTSGFGTLLHEERRLHSAIGSGIRRAGGLRAQKFVLILRQHAERAAGIASSFEFRYQSLPWPDRFLALHTIGSAFLNHTKRNPIADPLVHLTEDHEALIRRLENITTRDTVRCPPDVFSEAIHQHREMVWRLGNLLHTGVTTTAPAGASTPPRLFHERSSTARSHRPRRLQPRV